MDLLTRVKSLLGSKTQDNEGWIRKGKFTPAKNLTDIGTKAGNYFNPTSNAGNNFWSSQASQPLIKAQQFTQPVGRLSQSSAKGIVDFSTLGLTKNPFEQYKAENVPQKIAYGVGAGLALVNPFNPYNKAVGVLKGAKALGPAFRLAQKPLGNVAGKLISKGGVNKLLGQGVANVSQGIPYSATYALAKKASGQKYEGKDLALDTSLDLAMGSIPLVGGLMIGMKGSGYKKNLAGQFSSLADKKVRFEIDDSKARVLIPKDLNGNVYKLSQIFGHDELFKNYPEMANMPVTATKLGNGIQGQFDGTKIVLDSAFLTHPSAYKQAKIVTPQGQFSVNLSKYTSAKDKIKSTLLHEIQHAIQGKEGFAKGGSPVSNKFGFSPTATKKFSVYMNARDAKYEIENGVSKNEAIKKYLNGRSDINETEFKKLIDNFSSKQLDAELKNIEKITPYDEYLRTAGEVESRDVQARMNLTPEQRARTMPYSSQGIPVKDQIVRFDDGTSLSQPIKTGGEVNSPVGNQSGRIDTSGNLPPKNPGTLNLSNPQKVKIGQSQPKLQTPAPVKLGTNSSQGNYTTKQRGLISSVQKAPNISNPVKKSVSGNYRVKTNDKLMGEAQALLQSGATIDFKNTKDLDKKVAATIQEALNQQKAGNHEAAANLYNNLSEHATELGRGVQAFSLLKNMSPEAIALSAAGKIKKYNTTHSVKIPELSGEQIKMISDKVQAMDLLKGREKNIAMHELMETINAFIPSTFGDKFITTWKAGLLTSFRTHERNFVGNTIHALAETLKDIPATMADKIMKLKTGTRTTTFTLKGLSEFGSKETRQQIKDIIAKGYDPTEQINKFDYKTVTWGKNFFEQALKKYTDAVFRTLGASDKPFYNAALARSLYDQAAAAAINAGKRGNSNFIEKLVKNPTEEMIKIAVNDANIAVFKNKNTTSAVASAIKRTLSKNEISKIGSEIVMPFTGVPSSIFGQIGAYSPIGLINGIRKSGKVLAGQVPELQREAAKDLGRGVIGTAIFSLGSYLMGQGLITGQPKDAAEARQWDLENKPRNSIMIGGKWRSLNSIGPEAVVFLAGAKLNEEMSKPEGSLANYGVSIGKDYLDQSFVQGLQGPVNALTDPARYGKSYVGNLSSSFIPNIVKDASRAIDPVARETNNLSLNPLKNDYLKSGIPFVRNTLLPKRDALGNAMPQEPTGIGAFTDLFNSKTPISNPVVKELSRLYESGNSATPSKLTTSQTILKQKVKLTYEQLNNLEEGVGEVLRSKLELLISDPNYQKLDDEAKAKAIDKVVQDTRLKYKNLNADKILSGKSATGYPQINTTISNGYVDSSGNYKKVDSTPIPEPKLTGNKVIDDKLKLQYKNAVEKQMVDLAKSQQEGAISDESKVFSYIDEDGNYKTVDLTPIEFPKLTGNETVDKKLKSSYYSAINTQINNVIKLGQSGQISQEEMIAMVNELSEQYNKGKAGKKPKKVSYKSSNIKLSSLPTFKTPSFAKLGSSNIKLSKRPSLKLSNRKISLPKSTTKSQNIKIARLPTMKVTRGGSLG